MNESSIQSHVRLNAAKKGWKLFRNNVGVLKDNRGVPVRFGLANDTKALNSIIKSGDLIGWRSVTITPDMIGTKIAQFVSIECKRSGWSESSSDRDIAQKKWADLINEAGGYAVITSGEL